MPISYQPGEEIQLEVCSSRKFFTKALNWKDQKELRKQVEELKAFETDQEQTDYALDIICERLTRIEPPCELTSSELENVIDWRQAYDLLAALQMNMTIEEKKS